MKNDLNENPAWREKNEPKEGSASYLLAYIFTFVIVAGMAYYIIDNTQDSDIHVGDMRDFSSLSQNSVVDGKEVFLTNCAACHQDHGRGEEGVYPPLDGSEWVNGDEYTTIRILVKGIEGPIAVNNKTYNDVMPAWGEVLTPEEIAAVITYVRQSWSNTSSDVSVEMVNSVIEKYKTRPESWTGGDELKKIEQENAGAP